jgi:undecaprenyl-diphosphatase
MKRNRYIKGILLLILLILFITILRFILNDKIYGFDMNIFNLFHREDTLTDLMKIITFMGEGLTLIVIGIILLIIMQEKYISLNLFISLGIITLFTQIIKVIVKRPRPVGINLLQIGGYSFPSGHTTSAVSFYGLLIYFIYKSNFSKGKKIFLISVLSLLIFLIGISRIYLGVHYASDVLAGFILAIMHLILYISLANFIIKS